MLRNSSILGEGGGGGGKFEGNNSRAFLKEVDQIEGLCPTSNMLKNLQMLSKPRITLWQPVMVTNLLQIM